LCIVNNFKTLLVVVEPSLSYIIFSPGFKYIFLQPYQLTYISTVAEKYCRLVCNIYISEYKAQCWHIQNHNAK